MREVQLLFLHVMGEARDCPLVEGTPAPPAIAAGDSTLAEVSFLLVLKIQLHRDVPNRFRIQGIFVNSTV